MPIAREGVPIILAFLVLHLVFLAAGWLTGKFFSSVPPVLQPSLMAVSVLFALLALFSLYFFRDPERRVPQGASLVVSPADGRVLGIEDVEEKDFFQGPATRVSIFMSVFDVHVNRAPVSGNVCYRKYRPGKFFNASLDKASSDNESLGLGLEGPDSVKVLVRQIAGLIARRIVCRAGEGTALERGQRYGMIRFGSRLEVYLPPGACWQVSAGDRVTAGESIIARLP
ncbi:MAG: phosphatidylserine decarboxylase family protein [Gemmatimonadota bacterium]|nr:phosphatidylserine decarboxylase family protein [Gemmatimonadota bacterium]